MAEVFDPTAPLTFHRGIYKLNDEPHINYQLNRIINWDGGRLQDIQPIAAGIKNFTDWKNVILDLGRTAEAEGRTRAALGYTLMADFYTSYADPDKLPNYHHALELFDEYYRPLFEVASDAAPDTRPLAERFAVPYENGVTLPGFHVWAQGKPRGTILLHGGNDSYKEEFILMALFFAQHGYETYLYEGPGQGSVIRDQGCPFTWQWEKTSIAIDEYFDLHDVTIIGISLGGYFAPRAAAFDSRISRVVGWSVYPGTWDLVEGSSGKKALRAIAGILKTAAGRAALDNTMRKHAAKGDLTALSLTDMCHPYGAQSVSDMYLKMKDYTLSNCADKVTQDMLILGADNDVFISRNLAGKEVNMLTNTKSLALRMMTMEEDAGDHCNLGNLKLALDTILDWMHGLDVRDGLAAD